MRATDIYLLRTTHGYDPKAARKAVASSGSQLFSRAFLIKMPNN
jgi:hypothetical protein